MVARCAPEIPGRDTGRVPARLLIRPGLPEVDMPAEPVDRLSADAAEAAATREGVLAIGRRRLPEAPRQVGIAALAKPPGPPCGRAAFCRQRACEPVGAQGVGAAIARDRQPRPRR